MSLQSIKDSCADAMFLAKRRLLGRNRVRRARVYCLGMGKSGTHSIAAMFSEIVRSRHEPQAGQVLEKIFDREANRLSEEQFADWLHARDRMMALEVDSSALNFDLLDALLREFSNARFVLTIRDCYSWCNSLMNHCLRFAETMDPRWQPWLDSRMRPDLFHHTPEEQVLKHRGLYTLDGYLSYWSRHNSEVLDKVPAERLLAVRIDQIQQRAVEIADFAGLPRRAVRVDRAHDYQNPSKEQWLRQIDRNFLEAKVEKHCRPLMTRFFPEIKSLDDAQL
jgi:hypothetical protein